MIQLLLTQKESAVLGGRGETIPSYLEREFGSEAVAEQTIQRVVHWDP